MPLLSIVIPVYYNQDNLMPLYNDIINKLSSSSKFDLELVLVDDGSRDQSWNVMCELAQRDSRVKIYHLSRNFGSHAAILCGLSKSTGDCAVVKAADMQEPTEMILEMYEKWENGNNIVLAIRQGREESKSLSLFANTYYWMVRKTALPTMPKGGFAVYLLDRKVIDVIEQMDERNSAITGQLLWSGFRTDCVYYTRKARTIGKSRWTLKKKIRLVADTLFSFTTLPIFAISIIGAISFFGSLLWALFVLIARITGQIAVSGFTTLFIFNLFSFGIIMLTLGLLGGYLWRTFDASRKRPVYIVEDEGKMQVQKKSRKEAPAYRNEPFGGEEK